jgi:hypothetical protein
MVFATRPARPHGVRTPGELTVAMASRSEHLDVASDASFTVNVAAAADDALETATQIAIARVEI